MRIEDFIEQSYDEFSTFEKPSVATDINHCEECREHNAEVNGVNREELSPEQIGTVCWGISSFLTPEAMGYYMPRFIELAVKGINDKDGQPYMNLFINQIGLNANSKQFSLFSQEQRLKVRDSFVYLKEKYIQTLEEYCWDNEINRAIAEWGT